MAKKANPVKTVEWFSKKQMLIKFVGEEDSIFLADNVIEASDFEKYPIVEDDKVEVGVTDVDGEDKITYLRKQNKFTKKTTTIAKKKNPTTNPDDAPTETVADAPVDSSDGEVQTVKIISVRTDFTAMKIVGREDWPKIAPSLKGNPLLKSKNVVMVKIKDDVVVAVKASDKKEVKQEGKAVTKATFISKGTNTSIEGQVAIKEAGSIIRALIERDREEVNTIIKITALIKPLTKECFQAMQETV